MAGFRHSAAVRSNKRFAPLISSSILRIMLYRAFILSFSSVVAVAFSASASTDLADIQGNVLGADGHPATGAEIRVERKDQKGTSITTKTDAKGHYTAGGLSLGIYKISVIEGGTVKSAANIK